MSPSGTNLQRLTKLLMWQGLEPKPGTETTDRRLVIPCSIGWTQSSNDNSPSSSSYPLPPLTLSDSAHALWQLSQGRTPATNLNISEAGLTNHSLERNESPLYLVLFDATVRDMHSKARLAVRQLR